MSDNQLLIMLERLLAEARKPEITLWTAAECAEYLRMEEREFRRTTAKLADFPPVIKPTGRDKSKHVLWQAKEVQRWAVASARAA